MVNCKRREDKTPAGYALTVCDIQTIAIYREGAPPEVDDLLKIIDRITGTCWALRENSDNNT